MRAAGGVTVVAALAIVDWLTASMQVEACSGLRVQEVANGFEPLTVSFSDLGITWWPALIPLAMGFAGSIGMNTIARGCILMQLVLVLTGLVWSSVLASTTSEAYREIRKQGISCQMHYPCTEILPIACADELTNVGNQPRRLSNSDEVDEYCGSLRGTHTENARLEILAVFGIVISLSGVLSILATTTIVFIHKGTISATRDWMLSEGTNVLQLLGPGNVLGLQSNDRLAVVAKLVGVIIVLMAVVGMSIAGISLSRRRYYDGVPVPEQGLYGAGYLAFDCAQETCGWIPGDELSTSKEDTADTLFVSAKSFASSTAEFCDTLEFLAGSNVHESACNSLTGETWGAGENQLVKCVEQMGEDLLDRGSEKCDGLIGSFVWVRPDISCLNLAEPLGDYAAGGWNGWMLVATIVVGTLVALGLMFMTRRVRTRGRSEISG